MAAVGTVTKKIRRSFDGYEVEFVWTSDASGDVAEGGTTGKGVFTANGYMYSFVAISTTGVSDNYDVTLLDSDGLDVLRGQGLNMEQVGDQTYDTKYRSAVLDVDGKFFFFMNQNLTLTVANAGNAQTGTFKIKFTRSQP